MSGWVKLGSNQAVPRERVSKVELKRTSTGVWLWHIFNEDGYLLGVSPDDSFLNDTVLPARAGQHVLVFTDDAEAEGGVTWDRFDVIGWQVSSESAVPIWADLKVMGDLTVVSQEDGSYIEFGRSLFPNFEAAKAEAASRIAARRAARAQPTQAPPTLQ